MAGMAEYELVLTANRYKAVMPISAHIFSSDSRSTSIWTLSQVVYYFCSAICFLKKSDLNDAT
jgi:hypothetical protein